MPRYFFLYLLPNDSQVSSIRIRLYLFLILIISSILQEFPRTCTNIIALVRLVIFFSICFWAVRLSEFFRPSGCLSIRPSVRRPSGRPAGRPAGRSVAKISCSYYFRAAVRCLHPLSFSFSFSFLFSQLQKPVPTCS